MALNLFKRKQKEKPQAKDIKPELEVKEGEKEAKEEVASSATRRGGGKTKNKNSLPGILFNPHISEKASLLAEKGSYVFRVHPSASKGAVKQAVESLYGVFVHSVRFAKKPPKKIRVGKKKGIKSGLKKAVVQVKKGETIEVI